MTTWNQRDPESWARLLGLVAVPMFGTARAVHERGLNVVMLDGESGSFSWSIEDDAAPIAPEIAVQRAWSSNLRWSVILDSAATQATVRRWDDPHEVSQWPITTGREVRAVFKSFETTSHIVGQTVIGRGLETFRAIRTAVEKRGGSTLDVALAFNALLAWVADQTDEMARRAITFSEAVRILHGNRRIGFSQSRISRSMRDYPLGDLSRLLLEGAAQTRGFLLDADLLIRHASGTLNQEAHKQLREPARPDPQGELFATEMLLQGPTLPHAPPASGIHYTPPSLARALVEEALKHLQHSPGAPIKILDPACGSGVFLIEAAREVNRLWPDAPLQLQGFDESEIAVEMSEFCVRHTVFGIGDPKYTFAIEQHNSLDLTDWRSPNLILMNPPFVAWVDLSNEQRKSVTAALGPAKTGRPDMALAFIFRAVESLPVGGVLASVVPSSFLESQSAERLRQHLAQSGQYRIHLIGQFRAFDYFDATVQPAFVVISRTEQETPVRIVLADRGHDDYAIRALRRIPPSRSWIKHGFELYNREQHDLSPRRWTPQQQGVLRFIRDITTNTTTTVGDVFVPRLGIRVGNKPVFLLRPDEMSHFGRTKRERSYFRPIADQIDDGIIQATGYVFYPYGRDGSLRLTTQTAVSEELPVYFRERLLPAADALKSRKSLHHRKWWELSEPVATWLAAHSPRIVAQEFGRSGNFAVDSKGEFAVVQGFGWCWKDGAASVDILTAYLGLIHSQFFDNVLSCFCPRVRGQQYVLRRHFVEQVPLPLLDGWSNRDELASIGRRIADGIHYDRDLQEALVKRAYGLMPDGQPIHDVSQASERLERRFRELAEQWRYATAMFSFAERKVTHPTYRRIIELGKDVVPHLLRDLTDQGGEYWPAALSAITGVDPVRDSDQTQQEVASAWLKWGRDHGYVP